MTIMLLNGIWDFGSGDADCVEPRFTSVSPVPGCADAGKGEPRRKQRGFFRREVFWQGGDSLLTVDGMALRGEVRWDGEIIGKSELPFACEEFRFHAGEPGRHELLIITDNFTWDRPQDQHLALADFYVHTGIFGDVTLESVHPGDISHIAVIPRDHRTGEVTIRPEYFDFPPETLTVAFDNNRAVEMPYQPEITLKVPNFQVWDCDHPHLHSVTINGKRVAFGIRTLDWSGDRLLLNGRPIKLLGVNRHEAHPDFGAATPLALQAADLFRLKRAGFNFVRGSHYPQRKSFLELCDRLGIVVWEEAIGSGATEEQLQTPEFVAMQKEQCRKMVRKSINHPSVIIWGFLNETATHKPCARKVMQEMLDVLHHCDSSRPASFASCRGDEDLCLDLPDILAFNTYPGWKIDSNATDNDLEKVEPTLLELAAKYPHRPLIISEIGAAGMFGDRSGLHWSENYQAELDEIAMRTVMNHDRFSGIALWQFSDTGSFIEGELMQYRPRCFNNKGIVDEYRRPKMAYLALKKLLDKK